MWYYILATCLRGGRIWDRSSNSYDAKRGIFLSVDVVGNAPTREKESAFRLAFSMEITVHTSANEIPYFGEKY